VAAIPWGSWGPDPSLSASVGVQMCTDPHFLVPTVHTDFCSKLINQVSINQICYGTSYMYW